MTPPLPKLPGRPKGGGGQARILSRDELKRVDKCLVGTSCEHRDRAIVFFQHATGLRVGELASLDVGDLLHGKSLCREFKLGTEQTKYCRARTVYFESDKARSLLLAYLRTRSADLTLTPTEPLFLSTRRNHTDGSLRFTAQGLTRRFLTIYRQIAGLPAGASSHSGRRFFGTELRRNGVDMRTIQELLGHSSLATTQKYLDVTPREASQAVKGIRF